MKTTNIVAVGDIQICPKSYNIVDEFLNNHLIKIVREREADVVVFPGDIFEHSNYSTSYISSASVIEPIARFIDSLRTLDKPVSMVIIDGNHDKTYGAFRNANDIFKGDHIIHASSQIVVSNIGQVTFILLPWLMPHEYGEKDEILEYVRVEAEIAKEAGQIPILVGHIRVVGAVDSNYQVKSSDYSFQFTKDELGSLDIEYGILGDIHKPQKVVKSIDYLGCVRQRNVGEAGNASLVRIIKVEGNEVTQDEYIDLTDTMPQYVILNAENEEQLIEFMQNYPFESKHKYRIEVDFPTTVLSSFSNVSIKSAIRTKNVKARYEIPEVNLDERALIHLYNQHTKAFAPTELDGLYKFWESNKP